MAKRNLARLATALGAVLVVAVILTLPSFAHPHAAAIRPITPGRNIRHLPTEEKVCALTFDDWYVPAYLESILATLKAAGVTATFFPTGACVANDPALARSIAAAGCFVGSHTYSHPVMTHLTAAQVLSQIQRTEEASAEAGLPDPVPLFRAPYGNWNGRVYRVLRSEGYVDVLWSASAGDTARGGRLPSTAVKLIMRELKPGAIILQHASEPSSAECLPELLRQLKAQGYRVVDLATALFPSQQRTFRYEETSPLLRYLGGWTQSWSPTDTGGGLRRTRNQGASVTALFTGTVFEWVGLTGPDCGKASVIIDGGPAREVDLYSPTYRHRSVLLYVTGLADTFHTATITCEGAKNGASGGYYIDLDALWVTGSLSQVVPRNR